MNACFIGVEVPFIWTLLLLRPHSITWKGRLRGFGSAVCLKKNAEFHHSMMLILSKWPIYPKWINKYRLPSGREVMLPNLTASPRHDGHGGRKQKRAPFFFLDRLLSHCWPQPLTLQLLDTPGWLHTVVANGTEELPPEQLLQRRTYRA